MRLPALRLSVAAVISASLIGCASSPSSTNDTAKQAMPATHGSALHNVTLNGIVRTGVAKATVVVYDAKGVRKTATTDAKGQYALSAEGMTAPLMVVFNDGRDQFVSLVADPSGATQANVNALTDLVASDIAKNASFIGPKEMVESGKAPAVTAEALKAASKKLQPMLAGALKEAGVADAATFDPTASRSDGVMKILTVIRHNRGYDSKHGKLSGSAIYDFSYHPISKYSPLKLAQAQKAKAEIEAPGVVRVFVVGDSTASIYDVSEYPRTGWGQVFSQQFKKDGKVLVIDAAQSGRSSRSFINEGWFDKVAADIRKGDYLLAQFGHNDEKCGQEPPRPLPSRDSIDIANLCTYASNDSGVPADMSFRKTLEKYIAMAKSAGATPVLITPVTRRKFSDGKIQKTTHTTTKGKFPGDYSQTVRDTAKANGVALVDLDVLSMDFFNKVGESASLEYYLAVDPVKYPHYAKRTGRLSKPDNTHMQEKGALAMGGLVAQGLKADKLPLAAELK